MKVNVNGTDVTLDEMGLTVSVDGNILSQVPGVTWYDARKLVFTDEEMQVIRSAWSTGCIHGITDDETMARLENKLGL